MPLHIVTLAFIRFRVPSLLFSPHIDILHFCRSLGQLSPTETISSGAVGPKCSIEIDCEIDERSLIFFLSTRR